MNYGEALELLEAGQPVRRREWADIRRDGETCWLELVQPGPCADGREIEPLLMIAYPDRRPLRKFGGTDYDVRAADWEIVPDGTSGA